MSRQAMILTEQLVRTYSKTLPVDKNGGRVRRQRYSDGGVEGLVLSVFGSKEGRIRATWLFRKQKTSSGPGFEKTLGQYPEMSLSAARIQASLLKTQLEEPPAINALGIEVKEIPSRTLNQVAAEWFKHAQKMKLLKKVEYIRKEQQRFQKNMLDYIGNRSLKTLSAKDIAFALKFCWDREATCDRALAFLRKILMFAASRGYCGMDKLSCVNFTMLEFELGKKGCSSEPYPALSADEVPAFMKALRLREGPMFRMVELQILCALRANNARNLLWHQVFLKPEGETSYLLLSNEVLKISKNGNLKIPLSKRAVEILIEMKSFRNTALPKAQQFVFPSIRQPHKPFSDATPGLVIKYLHEEKKAEDGIGWIDPVATELLIARGVDNVEPVKITAHGTARSTFRTWASKFIQFHPKAIKLCLHHKTGDKVESAYDRYDYFEERRDILNQWSQFCLEEE